MSHARIPFAALRDALLARCSGPDSDRLAFDDGNTQLSYGELLERARGRACAFQAMGLIGGQRVALVMSSGIPFVEVFWALQLVGAVPCSFSPSVPSDTLAKRIDQVRPRMVVSDDHAAEMSLGRGPLAEPVIDPDEVAFLQPTSGTSGTPRAAMIRHRNVLAQLEANDRNVSSSDVFVGWAPPWHDLGLVRFVIGGVYHGAVCHLVEPAIRTIPSWLSTISRVGGTVTGAPDFGYRLATRMVEPSTVDLSTLRFATIAAEPVRRSTIENFERRFQVPGVVLPAYGLAEATLGATSHRPGDAFTVDARGNVSCGTPLSGVEVRAGPDVSTPAEICVRGETVFAGYFGAAQETNRALRDGWLHTGDSGYVDAGGRLFVLGRRSGMIKRAGGVISPRELEEAAQRVDGVRIAAAVSAPVPTTDEETIVVFVESDTSGVSRTVAKIVSEVTREIVASLGFAPGRVKVVAPRSIPRTPNGKVRHQRLRADLLEHGLD